MEFKDCKSATDLLNFFDNDKQTFRHTNYYHYTSLYNVNSMLESKQIRLTPLSRSANDLVEKETYCKLGDNIFSLCFSTGTSENLPLWYLYSGIDGHGARIGFKKSIFIKLIQQANVSLVKVAKEYPNKPLDSPIILHSTDYRLTCRDILYLGADYEKENNYRIKYNGQAVNSIEKCEIDVIKKNYARFVKGLIWFYEKETRVQIEVTNKALFSKDSCYIVNLDLSSVFDDISICLAPEYGELTPEVFDKYLGIRQWALTKLKRSEFAGQLKMNLSTKLCRDCKNK